MNTHRIRLRRPWGREPSGEGVRWRRPFNRPTGLGPQSRVWIVVEGISSEGDVLLNGRRLGRITASGGQAWRVEVSGLLALHNELVLEVAAAETDAKGPADSPPGEVALEIAEAG